MTFSMSAGLLTSPRSAVVPFPSSLAADCNRTGFCPTMMTLAPSSRNNLAASSPMPEVPPVTRAILFDSFMIFSWSEGSGFVTGARDPLAIPWSLTSIATTEMICAADVEKLARKFMRAPNHLNALRAFEAAARHLSYVAAADELNVTPAAVGSLVRGLEAAVGVSLFHRSQAGPARLELTAAAPAVLPAPPA